MDRTLAHIVSAQSDAGVAAWACAAVGFGGIVLLLLGRGKWRRVGGSITAAGLIGTFVAGVLAPTSPPSPGYSIELATPAKGAGVTSPVLVAACGRQPDGSPADVPGPGRLLTVVIDGRQVTEVQGAVVAVRASDGAHDIRVEILTSDHREFAPPLDADVQVRVIGQGPVPAAPRC